MEKETKDFKMSVPEFLTKRLQFFYLDGEDAGEFNHWFNECIDLYGYVSIGDIEDYINHVVFTTNETVIDIHPSHYDYGYFEGLMFGDMFTSLYRNSYMLTLPDPGWRE